jgi:arsenite transporter
LEHRIAGRRRRSAAPVTSPGGWATSPKRTKQSSSPVARIVELAERHQIAIYLLALAGAVALGITAPGTGPALEHAIEPVLALLLYATFLQVPFTALTCSFRDGRFLAAILGVNFVVVPVVVWALTLGLPNDRAVVLGVLLVLLTPCIDYVIVFAGLAGGSSQRLLAAAPLLMLAQLVLLPVYLLLFLGSDLAAIVEPGPFVRAFIVLIAIPLALAAATEVLAKRHRAGRWVTRVMTGLMVPLMAATLSVVVASQVPEVTDSLGTVARVLPVYIAFPVILAFVGRLVARAARLDVPAGRALTFSGATRNSLVVLPLALALPPQYAIAAVVVVTQTLVELVTMVVYVRLIPRLQPEPSHRLETVGGADG